MTQKKLKGQSLIEYGLIITLVSVVAMGALGTLGENVNTQLGAVGSALAQAEPDNEQCTGIDCAEESEEQELEVPQDALPE